MSDERSTEEAGASPEPKPQLPREHLLLQQAGDVIENLRSQMAALDRREQNVAAQTTALENERRRIRLSAQEFEEQMLEREAAVQEKEQTLAQQMAEQTQLREELAQQQSELTRQLREIEEQHRAGLSAIEDELAEERATRRTAMEAELLKLAETVEAEHALWKTEAAEKQRELAALDEQMESLRQEKLTSIERRETDLHKKQVELEKRTRFHESHLAQLRQTLQQNQAELDRERQTASAQAVQTIEQLDAYRNQLRRYRGRLDQREESLNREQRLLDDLRRSIEAHASEADSRWEKDRESWEQECAAHRADRQRQQDMLTLHAQNLESRRARLDQLRDDLEQTHRDTLELRLAVEQAWAQLSQSFGEESTRKRVEQARTELMDGYQKDRASLCEQQAEIDDAERRLAEQRERFRMEREEFTNWMSEREQQLQQREESLQREVQATAESEALWRKTRERWTLEKIEAESVIRQLLAELDADFTALSPPPSAGLDQHSSAAA